jgi:hypothetical protein
MGGGGEQGGFTTHLHPPTCRWPWAKAHGILVVSKNLGPPTFTTHSPPLKTYCIWKIFEICTLGLVLYETLDHLPSSCIVVMVHVVKVVNVVRA